MSAAEPVGPAQHGLVEHRVEPRRVGTSQNRLLPAVELHPTFDVRRVEASSQRPHDGAGRVFRLEQSGYDEHLVGVDRHGRSLETSACQRQVVEFNLPPWPPACLPGELQDLLALPSVYAVEVEQVADVTRRGDDLAILDAGDLGVRTLQVMSDSLHRQPGSASQTT
jgi:hypothetical protein